MPVVEEGKPVPPVQPKSLYKIVSEHKDVVKVVIMLSSIVSTFKADVKDVLGEMDQFKELWNEVGNKSRILYMAGTINEGMCHVTLLLRHN